MQAFKALFNTTKGIQQVALQIDHKNPFYNFQLQRPLVRCF